MKVLITSLTVDFIIKFSYKEQLEPTAHHWSLDMFACQIIFVPSDLKRLLHGVMDSAGGPVPRGSKCINFTNMRKILGNVGYYTSKTVQLMGAPPHSPVCRGFAVLLYTWALHGGMNH